MTISVLFLVKVLFFLIVVVFGGMLILFPLNDMPTSGVQWLIYVVVLLITLDILFFHYIHVSFDISFTT